MSKKFLIATMEFLALKLFLIRFAFGYKREKLIKADFCRSLRVIFVQGSKACRPSKGKLNSMGVNEAF